MKKIVPTGEYVLLSEVIPNPQKGGILLDPSAFGDKQYFVMDLGNEADTEIEKGDFVYVQAINLIKVALDGKTTLYMTNYKNIMGYEFKEKK